MRMPWFCVQGPYRLPNRRNSVLFAVGIPSRTPKMPSFTTLMEFDVDSALLHNPADLKKITSKMEFYLEEVGLKIAFRQEENLYMHFMKKSGMNATIQGHPQGNRTLVTVDLHEYVADNGVQKFTQQYCKGLEGFLKELFQSKKSKSLPGIRRGAAVQCYYPTTDDKLIEYDFDAAIYEHDSEFQNIKIMHSPQFGNMLILDEDPNLAESDLIYTHTIIDVESEDYKDKDVLVLGGGDGGILNELRKLSPRYITMVEIDGTVVDAAREHLRGICEDSLDNLKGHNYKVIIDDCLIWLEKFKTEGKSFDYIINDLTAIPVTKNIVGDSWDFIRTILELSMAVLKPTGKYCTQGNGLNNRHALGLYEKLLQQLPEPVQFTKTSAYVPSYHEQWVFYKMWKKLAVEYENGS